MDVRKEAKIHDSFISRLVTLVGRMEISARVGGGEKRKRNVRKKRRNIRVVCKLVAKSSTISLTTGSGAGRRPRGEENTAQMILKSSRRVYRKRKKREEIKRGNPCGRRSE